MNPQFHQEFVALCALFFSGELTDEEWALLQVHLAYCDTCRAAFEEYKQLHGGVIPTMAAAAAADSADIPSESESDFEEAERRLMARLDPRADPKNGSLPAHKARVTVIGLIAACIGAAAVLGYLRLSHTNIKSPTNAQTVAAVTPAQLPTPSVPTANALQRDLDESRRQIGNLREQLAAAEARTARSNTPIPAVPQRREEEARYQQLLSEKDSLARQLASTQSDLQALRDNLTTSQTSAAELTARTNSLETRVRQLSESLDEKNAALDDRERMLALDRDFLSHDRDIRDLIGARNLYIADIYDTNENGKTAKPFGRIFYTKDRSLAFYGFDLEKQPGLKRDVAFQAWGSGTDAKPVSLGLFYQDDSHKRWVVRFNDPKTLSRLNTVFVTVEPPGGSNKPTGKQLLRAYLQIQANHP